MAECRVVSKRPRVRRNTLAFALFFIASYPEAEEKIMSELRELGLLACRSNPNPRQMEFSDIAQLPFLKAVVKETLRLLPVSGRLVLKVCVRTHCSKFGTTRSDAH